MKHYCKIASLFTILATFSLSATAETYAYRHSSEVDIALGGPSSYGLIVVYTNPIRANEPVYAWRTHKIPGGYGSLGYSAELLGETDDYGILHFASETPNNPIYCGKFENERFAVGSTTAPKSDPLSFIIYRSIDFGPMNLNCDPYSLANL